MKFNDVRWNVKGAWFFYICFFFVNTKSSTIVCRISNNCCLPCELLLTVVSERCISGMYSVDPQFQLKICMWAHLSAQYDGFPYNVRETEVRAALSVAKCIYIYIYMYGVNCRWISVSMEHLWYETRRENRWTREQGTQCAYDVTLWLTHSRLFYTSSATRKAFHSK